MLGGKTAPSHPSLVILGSTAPPQHPICQPAPPKPGGRSDFQAQRGTMRGRGRGWGGTDLTRGAVAALQHCPYHGGAAAWLAGRAISEVLSSPSSSPLPPPELSLMHQHEMTLSEALVCDGGETTPQNLHPQESLSTIF